MNSDEKSPGAEGKPIKPAPSDSLDDPIFPESVKRVTLTPPSNCVEAEPADCADDLLPESARGSAGRRRFPVRAATSGGERFGDYELIESLGRGAMGAVFKARHVRLNRLVALKFIRDGHHCAEAERKRFLREAEAVARLQHPHIVVLYEAGEVEGQPFLAMEYVPGNTLAEILAGNPLPPQEAARCLRKIAEAIHYAHQQGVLHRDLKPSNIILDPGLEPRVMDFGLARLMEQDSEMTLSGVAIGTPSYMAPEQAAGKVREVGEASDVYALGAILYQALTGRPPFQADTSIETMRQVAQIEPVSPRLLNATVPRDLETICLKCLEKEPRRRYATAQDLAEDLARFGGDEPIEARPAGAAEKAWRLCRRNRALASAIGIVLALAVVVGAGSPIALFRISRERRRAENNALSELQERRLAESLALQSRRRLYAARINLSHQVLEEGDLGRVEELLNSLRPQAGEEDLRGFEWYYLEHLCHNEMLSLTGHVGFVRSVVFSPDGRTLASAGDDAVVRLWDAATGEERVRLKGHTNIISAVAFSPDGRTLASVGSDGTARLWDSETGEGMGVLWTETNSISTVAFSPDGHFLAAGAAALPTGKSFPTTRYAPPCSREGSHITLWDLQAARLSWRINAHRDGIYSLGFAPDGASLVSGGRDGEVDFWDPATGRLQNSVSNSSGPVFGLCFAPDGRRLATAGWTPTFLDGDLQLLDLEAGRPAFRFEHPGQVTCLAYSPDGATLATAGTDQLFRLWDARTGRLQAKFTRHSGVIWSLAWAPDGRRLATASWDGTVRLWDTTQRPDAEAVQTPANFSVAFSPDGKLMAAGGVGAELRDLATGDLVRTLSGIRTDDVRVVFSPDGNLLAACGADSVIHLFSTRDWNELGTFPAPGSRITALAFSPDSGTIAAPVMDKSVRLFDVSSRSERSRLPASENFIVTLAFTPDGKSLITGGKPIRFWDPGTGKEQGPRFESAVRLAVSPDGKKLAAALWNYSVVLFDLETMTELFRLKGHKDEVFGLTFSPDGKTLVTASWDSTVKLWHVASGEPLLTLKSAYGVSWCVAFSPDNTMLAFGSGRASGGEITLLRGPTGAGRGSGELVNRWPAGWLERVRRL